MKRMGNKRKKPTDEGGEKKPRKDTTVNIPRDLHDALLCFAKAKSDDDDRKSLSWAARHLLRKALTEAGFYPLPKPPEER